MRIVNERQTVFSKVIKTICGLLLDIMTHSKMIKLLLIQMVTLSCNQFDQNTLQAYVAVRFFNLFISQPLEESKLLVRVFSLVVLCYISEHFPLFLHLSWIIFLINTFYLPFIPKDSPYIGCPS